jgi:pyrroline-5-carboxylate reductase
MNIHIIGGGNLGTSVATGIALHNNVTVTRRNVSKIEHLKELGITVSTDTHCIEQADIIIEAAHENRTKTPTTFLSR